MHAGKKAGRNDVPDNGERVGGDGLVDLLPLWAVVGPDPDLPLDRLRVGKEGLLEVREA